MSAAAHDLFKGTAPTPECGASYKRLYVHTDGTLRFRDSTGAEGTLADSANFVAVTGAQSIAGVKTFTDHTIGLNFAPGYTTTATAAGTTTLTSASTHNQYFTGATTQTVALPVTSTLTTGHSYRITNLSTGAVTVQSSGANTVVVVAPGTTVVVRCILTTGTGAASWSYDTGITGITDGSVVAAGAVGQILKSTNITQTVTTSPTNVTSLSLTAGRWLVYVTMTMANAGANLNGQVALSTNSASFTGVLDGYTNMYFSQASTYPVSASFMVDINISSTTTYYMVGAMASANGNMIGSIIAARIA